MLKRKITEQELINTLGEYNIYCKYFGEFDLTSCYPSIFRKDEHPSTGFFRNSSGRIVYNDYSTDEKLNCIGFVQKLFGINYFQAIERIAIDFGIADGEEIEIPIVKKTLEDKKPKKIEITLREMDANELNYWSQYHITEEELLKNHVYGVKEFRINHYLIPESKESVRFAYVIHYKDKEYIKVYTPFEKDYKWVGNATGSVLFGFDELPYKSDKLIITKSKKDEIVLKKIFTDVVSVQREGVSAISKADLQYFKEKYKKIYVWFDNDKAGLKTLSKLDESLIKVHYPEYFLSKFQIKDSADFVKNWGVANLKKWISQQEIFK